MIADIVVGLQHGDEAKGKITHQLCDKYKYDYVLRFNSYFFKSIGERKDKDDTISTANHASLKIFISGSAITGASGEEDYFLGEVDVPDSSADQGEIKNVIGRFTSAGSGSPKAWIKFELN